MKGGDYIIDAKIIRAGVLSGVLLILTGLAFGNFGAWQPFLSLVDNIFGKALLIIIDSIFLAFIFQRWFSNFLPGSPLVQGAILGFLIWVTFLILGGLLGFFKEAVYPALDPGKSLFLNLLINLVWGCSVALFLESSS
ncbi:MAG TPA: hypothetical protein VLE47_01245 [Candidatus Saccharimonadales bacterium]|nr:hypothetical protein [Candidatus Saccharimonadales bacterium]